MGASTWESHWEVDRGAAGIANRVRYFLLHSSGRCQPRQERCPSFTSLSSVYRTVGCCHCDGCQHEAYFNSGIFGCRLWAMPPRYQRHGAFGCASAIRHEESELFALDILALELCASRFWQDLSCTPTETCPFRARPRSQAAKQRTIRTCCSPSARGLACSMICESIKSSSEHAPTRCSAGPSSHE